MPTKKQIYQAIDSTKPGHKVLQVRRQVRDVILSKKVDDAEYSFDDRSTGADKMCMILSGYKEPLWDDVFGRLAAFLPGDVDVCIMTSGLVNEQLRAMAAERGWSYLSTSINHLSLIQNLAIQLHPNAQWIYKLDEDMFLTAGFFEKMLETWQDAKNNSLYDPAFVAPTINVNCYSHLRLLEKLDLLEDFRATGLTDMKIAEGLKSNVSVIEDPEVAKYIWGETQPILRDIDALTERFSAEPLTYSICPMRFSIGAIMFARETWRAFGGFPISFEGSRCGLGDDEEYIGYYSFFYGKAIVVNENVVVGHLGYGPQTKAMIEYYKQHKDRFALKA